MVILHSPDLFLPPPRVSDNEQIFVIPRDLLSPLSLPFVCCSLVPPSLTSPPHPLLLQSSSFSPPSPPSTIIHFSLWCPLLFATSFPLQVCKGFLSFPISCTFVLIYFQFFLFSCGKHKFLFQIFCPPFFCILPPPLFASPLPLLCSFCGPYYCQRLSLEQIASLLKLQPGRPCRPLLLYCPL